MPFVQVQDDYELVTVPVAALTGLATGVKAGSAAVNFEIEAGLAYNELLANGVSEKTARNIALGVGGANAALELVQLDELTDAFKITKQTGATKNVAKVLAEEIVKRTGGVARETAQEVLQEGVTVAGVQAGTKLDTGTWAYDTKEVTQRLWDTGTSAAGTFGVLNVPSTAVDIAAMRQQLIDRQHQQSMDELAAEYEKNVGMPIYKEESYMRVQQEQSIAKSEVSKYNNIIGKHIQEDCTALLQAAKNGERHEGIYADAVKKDQRKLKKSIASHAAQVEEHAAKIANPSIYDVGWMDKDQRAKEGLLRKWEKDMKRNAEQAAIEIAVWEERYGNEQ